MRRTLVTRDHDVDEFGPKLQLCDEGAKFGAKSCTVKKRQAFLVGKN
jgi:hypothetical protein